MFDVANGDFEIDDNGLAISNTVLARHSGAVLLGLRIGYNPVYAIGGVLTRTAKPT